MLCHGTRRTATRTPASWRRVPRICRLAGSAVLVVLAIAIVFSLHGQAVWCWDRFSFVMLSDGAVDIALPRPPPYLYNVDEGFPRPVCRIGWRQVALTPRGFAQPVLWPRRVPGKDIVETMVPLWIPLVLVGVLTLIAWRRERHQHPSGRCQRCGYDLTGNVSGRCPECGMIVRA